MRAFLALELAPETRAAANAAAEALRARLGEHAEGLRFVREEALHVTLRFLGDIEAEQVPALCQAVASELERQPPFELRLAEPSAFPNVHRPRVVVLGVAPEATLVSLAAACERGVQAAGFAPEERPFRAHLTLARVRDRAVEAALGEALAEQSFGAEAAAMQAHELVLFQSDLESSGARHTPLERLPLGSPAA